MRIKHTMTPAEEKRWVAEQQRLIREREQKGSLPSVTVTHGWPPEPD